MICPHLPLIPLSLWAPHPLTHTSVLFIGLCPRLEAGGKAGLECPIPVSLQPKILEAASQ